MNLNFEIKPLNEQQYSEAPEAVRRVYISVLENIPLSTQELKTTIKAYPDYFRLKSTEKPKTFGQKVKRLFNLKNHLTSVQKKSQRIIKVMAVKKDDVIFPPNPSEEINKTAFDSAQADSPEDKAVNPKS